MKGRRGGDAQFDSSDILRRVNVSVEPLRSDLDAVKRAVQSLQNTVGNLPVSYAEILNLLDNSKPEWSHAAYTTLGVLPTDAGDDNHKAYSWFRHLTTTTILGQADADALKSAGHSLFAGTEGADGNVPRWVRDTGEIEIGSTDPASQWFLAYPLPNNLAEPGMTLYVQFEAKLRTDDAMPQGLQVYAAIYDNTSGQEKIIEGGNFTITGEIYGIPGTRQVEYQVKAFTDSGEEAVSNILSFLNAPDVFSQENHPRINVRGAPGFTRFQIFRRDAAPDTYVLQYEIRNSIDSAYFDVGNAPIRSVPGFPSPTATPPRAYAKTRTFVPGSLSSSAFVRHSLTILVPTTYDRTNTDPNSQWLIVGLTIPTDAARQIVMRRFGLSQGDGQWSRSPNDSRTNEHSTPTSQPTSGDQGGSGGGVGDPPPPGSGGGCVLMTSLINVLKNDGQIDTITLARLKHLVEVENEVVYLDSGGGNATIGGRVLSVKTGHVTRIARLKTEFGKTLGATLDHPLISHLRDIHGTPVSKLNGKFTLTRHKGATIQDKIVYYNVEFGDFEVGIPILEGSHIFVANDLLSHNLKNQYGGVEVS